MVVQNIVNISYNEVSLHYLRTKCPKISSTKVSVKIAYAISADPDQTAAE